MSKYPKILIVAVDYNSNDYTESFLNSLNKLKNRDCFYVHIAFTGKQKIESNYESINFHFFDNIGYFNAIDKVLKSINYKDYNFIITCNNDIKILSNDLYYKLIEDNKNYDVIAPDIINDFGVHQNPHILSVPTNLNLILYNIYCYNHYFTKILLKTKHWLSQNKYKSKMESPPSSFIYSPHGAFIIFNKSYFEKGGVIDTGFFLYGEENSIGAICREKGCKVYLNNKIKILHHEGVSTGKKFNYFKWKEHKIAFKYISKTYSDFKLFK